MINDLIKLATHLDSEGLSSEANYIDGLLKSADELGSIEEFETAEEEVSVQAAINSLVQAAQGADELLAMSSDDRKALLDMYDEEIRDQVEDMMVRAMEALKTLDSMIDLNLGYGVLDERVKGVLEEGDYSPPPSLSVGKDPGSPEFGHSLPLVMPEASAIINNLIKTSDTLDRGGMIEESDSVDKAINLLISITK
jgi:hypothetical protein